MSTDELRTDVLRILGELAPEADTASLKPDVRIRDQLDLDSMDFLNFLIAVHEATGVDIPEADYPRLRTLDEIIAYLEEKRAAHA
jgi:acyl carrier protein